MPNVDSLTWGSYLYRTPSGLRCGTREDVPKCEACAGTRHLHYGNPAIPSDTLDVPCPDCHGTGLGWNWQVMPENWVGGLVAWVAPAREHWGVLSNEDLGFVGPPYLPLAPPPTAGCTLAEALACLPDSYIDQGCLMIELGGAFEACYGTDGNGVTGLELDIEQTACYGSFNPDAVILAATRYKALAAYCAAWGAE